MPLRRWNALAVSFACWTGIGVFLALQYVFNARLSGGSVSFSRAFAWAITDGYAWAILSTAVVAFSRSLPISSPGWPRSVGILAAGGIAFSLAHIVILVAFDKIFGWPWAAPEAFWPGLLRCIGSKLHIDLLIFALIASVGQAMEYRNRLVERERAAASLEAMLAEARLASLQAQIRPHFLFNTLHSITELIVDSPELAEKTLIQLSELLRSTLRTEARHRIPLAEEMALLRNYVEIEKTVLGGRLDFRENIGKEAAQALVPMFLLQPLVENAICHGIERRAGAGLVEISAHRNGDLLELEIQDDGVGISAVFHEGLGLSNARRRLAALHGIGASMELGALAAGGTRVTLRIPFELTKVAQQKEPCQLQR
jgi:two-component system LytT family sensor kinase